MRHIQTAHPTNLANVGFYTWISATLIFYSIVSAAQNLQILRIMGPTQTPTTNMINLQKSSARALIAIPVSMGTRRIGMQQSLPDCRRNWGAVWASIARSLWWLPTLRTQWN